MVPQQRRVCFWLHSGNRFLLRIPFAAFPGYIALGAGYALKEPVVACNSLFRLPQEEPGFQTYTRTQKWAEFLFSARSISPVFPIESIFLLSHKKSWK